MISSSDYRVSPVTLTILTLKKIVIAANTAIAVRIKNKNATKTPIFPSLNLGSDILCDDINPDSFNVLFRSVFGLYLAQ